MDILMIVGVGQRISIYPRMLVTGSFIINGLFAMMTSPKYDILYTDKFLLNIIVF